ncbi:hypothetical protein MHYP_G00061640 [Metynnis hypsauchen]
MDLSGTSVFYQSVLRAWSLALRNTRSEVQLCSLVEEEPLFYNPLIPVTELTFKSIRLRFQRAGITKLGDLRVDEDWKSSEVLRAATGIMSVRLLQRIVGGVASSLPTSLKEALQHHSAGDQETFPSLPIAAEMGDHQEEEGALLSFRTPQLAGFAEVSKKALYSICVKVLHRNSLDGLKESRWLGLLAPASSPQGSWRSLYKPPIEKRAGDLQWRIVHGAVATNRHVAHIDPTIGRRRAAVTSRGEGASAPAHGDASTLAVTSEPSRAASSDGQDDVQYSSVHFSRSQTKDVPLSSTVHPSHALREEEEVQYAAVNTARPGAAQ